MKLLASAQVTFMRVVAFSWYPKTVEGERDIEQNGRDLAGQI